MVSNGHEDDVVLDRANCKTPVPVFCYLPQDFVMIGFCLRIGSCRHVMKMNDDC